MVFLPRPKSLATRRWSTRRLLLEQFESRQLMAADWALSMGDAVAVQNESLNLSICDESSSASLTLPLTGSAGTQESDEVLKQLFGEGEGPNQAPLITNGAVVNLPTLTEDQNFPGPAWRGVFTVSTLLRNAGYSDVDNSDALFGWGIAITGFTGRGYLAYATELDGAWIRVPVVSETSALLLATNFQDSAGYVYPQWLCYVPDGANGEQVNFTYRAWDLTSGTPSNATPASRNGAPSFGDASINGGSTAYSSGSASGRITVTSVNDAPTIANAVQIMLPTINENTTSAAISANSILTSSLVGDVDVGAVRGVAIVSMVGNGKWQYSTDGVVWNNIAAVSETSSLLLSASSRLRYLPDLLNGETVSFSFKAWDQTSGLPSTGTAASYGNASVNGGSTAYSVGTARALMNVTSVNDAPTMTSGVVTRFIATNENMISAAKTVDSLLSSSAWNDVDIGALSGIAISSTSGFGNWQYSTDGVTWVNVGTVSSSSSLLLAGSSRLRYAPDLKNGETARISFKAWDQSSGIASTNTVPSYGRTTPSGGTSAFSTSNAQAIVQVVGFNDAPTIVSRSVQLAPTDEDTTSSPTQVEALLDSVSWSDVDIGALKGVAIMSATGRGNWQYTTDGTTWVNVGQVSATSALLLGAGTQLRFDPDRMDAVTAYLNFRAWDQTTGSASTSITRSYGNATVTGGTNAYSVATALASLNVRWFNDAPTITENAVVVMQPTSENTVSEPILVSAILNASNWQDVDVNAVPGLAVIGATGAGQWQFSNSGTFWTPIGPVSDTQALILGQTTRLRYVPNGRNGETATLRFRAWDSGLASGEGQPLYRDATIVGGRSNFSANVGTVSITVSSVNDAPVITNGAVVNVPVTDQDFVSPPVLVSSLLSSSNWNDVDNGAVGGIAVVALGRVGTWQYSVDGTVWVTLSTVSDSAALLLSPTTQLRCWLNLLSPETPTLSFKAWDQTTGLASTGEQPEYGDASLTGGSTAFSNATAQVAIINLFGGAPLTDVTAGLTAERKGLPRKVASEPNVA